MEYYLHVKLIGSGTDEDPFRAAFPTYQMRTVDYAAGRALIIVPDGVLPDGLPLEPFNDPVLAPKGVQVVSLARTGALAVERHIRERYPSAFPDWRLDHIR